MHISIDSQFLFVHIWTPLRTLRRVPRRRLRPQTCNRMHRKNIRGHTRIRTPETGRMRTPPCYWTALPVQCNATSMLIERTCIDKFRPRGWKPWHPTWREPRVSEFLTATNLRPPPEDDGLRFLATTQIDSPFPSLLSRILWIAYSPASQNNTRIRTARNSLTCLCLILRSVFFFYVKLKSTGNIK